MLFMVGKAETGLSKFAVDVAKLKWCTNSNTQIALKDFLFSL